MSSQPFCEASAEQKRFAEVKFVVFRHELVLLPNWSRDLSSCERWQGETAESRAECYGQLEMAWYGLAWQHFDDESESNQIVWNKLGNILNYVDACTSYARICKRFDSPFLSFPIGSHLSWLRFFFLGFLNLSSWFFMLFAIPICQESFEFSSIAWWWWIIPMPWSGLLRRFFRFFIGRWVRARECESTYSCSVYACACFPNQGLYHRENISVSVNSWLLV